MLIKKKELEELSANVRKAIDGRTSDFRDNKEGAFSVLKNDIYTLVSLKNDELEAAGREREQMSEYLADISHQLKTPITSMRIMADLLGEAPPDKEAEFISNIKTSLTRMEWLVSSLLKMAKLDSGAVQLIKEQVPASRLLEAAAKPLEILLEVKNQRVELLHDGDLFCDLKWTGEALTNLLKNASENSPENSLISVDWGDNPIYSWLSVTDGGKGISRADTARLFKRFESSQNEKGYGIGLPLALSILRSQGGDLEVDGGGHGMEKGKGAVFTMRFFK